jgi:uncharacterized Zn finger protein (UPF0148 family)
MADGTHEILCPCCGASITVDAATGAVLFHVEPRKTPQVSFEEAANEVQAARNRAASKFQKAMDERAHQSEILEKKFRKALEKAADDDAPPEKPFDLD